MWAARGVSAPSSSSPSSSSPHTPPARNRDGPSGPEEGVGQGSDGASGSIQRDTDKDTDKEKDKERSNLTVKSVACGDFHSAALTHSGRLYVWGACAVPVSGADSLSHLSPTPVTDPCSPKVDVTSSLGGVPTKVTALYCTALHYTALHYTTLHYTTLLCSPSL